MIHTEVRAQLPTVTLTHRWAQEKCTTNANLVLFVLNLKYKLEKDGFIQMAWYQKHLIQLHINISFRKIAKALPCLNNKNSKNLVLSQGNLFNEVIWMFRNSLNSAHSAEPNHRLTDNCHTWFCRMWVLGCKILGFHWLSGFGKSYPTHPLILYHVFEKDWCRTSKGNWRWKRKPIN